MEFCRKNGKILVICENPGKKIYDFTADETALEGVMARMAAMFFSFAAELEAENIRIRVKSAHVHAKSW